MRIRHARGPAIGRLILGCCLAAGLTARGEPPTKPIGSHQAAGICLAPPRPGALEHDLRRRGALRPDASAGETREVLAEFRRTFARRAPIWVNPLVEQRAREHEDMLGRRETAPRSVQPVSAAIFGLAVEFGGPETVWMYDANTNLAATNLVGPVRGRIPPPGPLDNQTIWYEPARTEQAGFYTNLIVGYTGAGRVRFDLADPLDGRPGINLGGFTAQDYFDRMAGPNNVRFSAAVEGWVAVPHSEGFYGAPNRLTGAPDGGTILNGSNVPAARLVADALAAFHVLHPGHYTDTGPDAFWPRFDADGDGVLDTCWIFHAGKGEEAGGGSQGEFAVWSHSGDLRNEPGWNAGLKVYEGDPATTNDDIVAGPYAIFPENADLGALTAALCRNLFGLPALDTDDMENSIGFWASPAAGSWTGPLGGAAPAPLPLWLLGLAQTADGSFLNWQEPLLTLHHGEPATNAVLGRLEDTPAGLPRGLRLNLPPLVNDPLTNRLNTGRCAYSGRGRDQADLLLARALAVPAGATNLTFRFACDIEPDWDYGYLLADGVSLPDLDGLLTTSNPYGNNLGHGLTGLTNGTLRFDVTAWRGQTKTFAWRYKTDAFVTGDGWWVDEIRFDGALIEDFETAAPPDTFPAGWSNSTPGWLAAPLVYAPTNFYLVEWRAPGTYDAMTRTAFATVYADEHDWRVVRTPYHLPGALVYHRDARFRDSRWLSTGYFDPPAFGPKYQLLVVDLNYRAVRLAPTGAYSAVTFGSQVGSFDAALTLEPNPGFTLEEAWAAPSIVTGRWTIPPRPALPTFRDAKGYAAGFEADVPFNGYLYYANLGGSAVIPASDRYSTRMTDRDGNPYWMLYDLSIFGYPLGSGCPGAGGAALGLDIRVLSQSDSADRALLAIGPSNPGDLLTLSVQKAGMGSGTVRSTDGLILCDNLHTSAAAYYAQGSVVTLQIETAAGSTFAGWSSADVGGLGTQAVFQLFDHTAVLARFPAPPAALPDQYRVPAFGARTVPAPGVLANDANPEHGRLWAELVSGCARGALSLRPDGSFTYTPPPGFAGTDTFTYRAVGEYDTPSSNTASVTLLVQPLDTDYNGNGRSDLAVYDPATGAWYIRTLAGQEILWNLPWGGPGFDPMAGDYNGDNLADLAVYDRSQGLWYFRRLPQDILAWADPWGRAGLRPVAGDFNGDGLADLAVYDATLGLWYVRTLEGTCLAWAQSWGGPGFEPVAGDFDGDGRSDLAVYHRASGAWYVRSLTAGVLAWAETWGGPGLDPVPGDFDGDGRSDLAVYHRASGAWYIRSLTGSVAAWAETWGGPGLDPVPGDFDGDGCFDLAVYHRASGAWYIRSLTGSVAAWAEMWGGPGLIPVGAAR
jgi:immune inhibitor A